MPIKTDTSDGDGGGAPGGAPPAAGTITATQTADTAVAYNCLGARAIVFMLAGADAHTLSNVAPKVSNDGTHYIADSTTLAMGGDGSSTALNASPISVEIAKVVTGNSDNVMPFPWRYCKLTVTAGASDVTGFNSTATIIR